MYELLTGETPLDLKSLKPEMLEERLRRIREQEPVRPSNRVSNLGENASAMATYRNSEVITLTRQLRGDLDTIVLKALEKERSQRYDNATDFAEELKRYLNDEPLTIRPPTTLQRIGRTYRRNKLIALSGAAVFAALAIGLGVAIGAVVSLNKQIEQRVAAEEKVDGLLNDYLDSLEESGLRFAYSGNLEKTNQIAEQIERVNDELNNKRRKARPDILRGLAYFWSGDTETAKNHLRRALKNNKNSIAAKAVYAIACSFGNETDEYHEFGDLVISNEHNTTLDDFDRLFIGSVKTLRDSAAAVEDLKVVVSNKPNLALARSAYADALAHKALIYRDPKIAKRALDELENARTITGENALLNLSDLFAHLVALSMLDPDSSEYLALVDKSRQLIQLLEKYPDFKISRGVENWFYLSHGDDLEKRESSRRLLKTGVYLWSAAAYLMQNDKESAYALLGDEINKDSLNALNYLKVAKLLNGDANKQSIIHELTPLLRRTDLRPGERVDVLTVLALAGDPKLAEKAYRLEQSVKLVETECFPDESATGLCQRTIDSVGDAKTFVESRSDQNPYQAGYLYYVAGLILVGNENESEALKCFKLCIEQNQLNCPAFYFSRAFINKLETD